MINYLKKNVLKGLQACVRFVTPDIAQFTLICQNKQIEMPLRSIPAVEAATQEGKIPVPI